MRTILAWSFLAGAIVAFARAYFKLGRMRALLAVMDESQKYQKELQELKDNDVISFETYSAAWLASMVWFDTAADVLWDHFNRPWHVEFRERLTKNRYVKVGR